ncbi:MAG: hypothetical protein HQL72_00485 [Magnetococcales bacterium]|nr:hypothetical protein [Magnetococcales bacterium]
MNMPPDNAGLIRGGCQHKRGLVLVVLFSLLTGCSDPNSSSLDASFYAKDSTWEKLRHFFTPESYWQKKVVDLTAELEVDRAFFHEENQRYRALLSRRRQQVVEAVAEAKKSGSDPKQARQQVILSFRAQLDPARTRAREAGRKLRQKMDFLTRLSQELTKAQ